MSRNCNLSGGVF